MNLRASIFNIFIKIDDDQYLLYNTLKKTSSIIPPSLVEKFGWDITENKSKIIRSFKEKEILEKEELEQLNNFPEQLVEIMTKKGFLVKNKNEDYEQLDKFLNKGYNPDIFYPVIAYTSRCNLACSYCFQEGTNRDIKLSQDSINRTLKWIEKYIIDNGKFKGINLGLFGGEPLMDKEIGNIFIDEVIKITNKHNISFEFGITTNGTLIKKDFIENWVKKGLTYIRITLDGPKYIHDKRRFQVNGKGTYNTILKNLIKLTTIKNLRIGLEINIDEHNSFAIKELLDDLENSGLKNKVELTPEPTLQTEYSSSNNQEEHHCNQYCTNDISINPAFSSAINAIIDRGFKLPEFVGVYYPCIFVQKHHVVVDWNGNLYKCSFTMGNDEMCVGNTKNGFNEKNNEMLGAKKVVEECKKHLCAYLPICGGGCRYESWNKTGSLEKIHCKINLIDEISLKTLPAHFKL